MCRPRGNGIAVKVETALISVSDKRGLVEFGLGLAERRIEIYSTGNTYKALQQELGAKLVHEAGGQDKLTQLVARGQKASKRRAAQRKKSDATDVGGTYNGLLKRVSEYTEQEETLNGWLKTLDRRLFEGILTADRGQAQRRIRNGNGSQLLLDMVVVNFYPFQQAVSASSVTEQKAIDKVDIGGPAMVRSAAKNYKNVIVVVDPDDYPSVLQRLNEQKDTLTWRKQLALKAWRVVADYDQAIADFFENRWAKTTSSQKN